MKKDLTVDELIAAKQLMEQRIARIASEEVAAFSKKTGVCVEAMHVNFAQLRTLESTGTRLHSAVTGVEASIVV